MSIPRITNAVVSEYGVAAEPDVLSGTPAQNKSVFDRLVREKVAPSLNAVIDEWEAYRADPSSGGAMGATVYDPTGRKADIFALTDAICVDLGVTSGNLFGLVLPAPAAPLRTGARVRYKTHTSLSNLAAAQTLKIGDMEPLPVYTPFRGATAIPADTLFEAVYTGSDYRVTFISSLCAHGDTAVAWTVLDSYMGAWEPGLRVCKINGIVYLQGAASQNLTQSGMAAILPVGMRPKVNLPAVSAPGTDDEASRIILQSNGIINHEYKGVPWRPALCVSYPCEN